MRGEAAQVRELIVFLEETGAIWEALYQTQARARAATESGDIPTAIGLQEQAMTLVRQLGDDREVLVGLADHLYTLAALYSLTDRHEEGVQTLEQVVALGERVGHPATVCCC